MSELSSEFIETVKRLNETHLEQLSTAGTWIREDLSIPFGNSSVPPLGIPVFSFWKFQCSPFGNTSVPFLEISEKLALPRTNRDYMRL